MGYYFKEDRGETFEFKNEDFMTVDCSTETSTLVGDYQPVTTFGDLGKGFMSKLNQSEKE